MSITNENRLVDQKLLLFNDKNHLKILSTSFLKLPQGNFGLYIKKTNSMLDHISIIFECLFNELIENPHISFFC